MNSASTDPKVLQKSLRQSMNFWLNPWIALTLLALGTVSVLASGLDPSGETVVSFGALSVLGRVLGPLLGKSIGTGASRIAVPSARSLGLQSGRTIAPISRVGGGRVPAVLRKGAIIGAAGGAFELGTRALPGGSPFPGDLSIPGFGGGGGAAAAGAAGFQVGARFGDTFITRIWVSGTTREGVQIVHGLLANGRRFVTNRFGTIKTFTVKKPIVIGADPRLSDANKLARAATKMTRTAEKILAISGKKAIKR